MSPAAPASAPPMKKVRMIVFSTSIPIASAVSLSWAVARIALPQRVRVTKYWSATIRGMVVARTRMSLVVMKSSDSTPTHSRRMSTEGNRSG